MLLSLSKDFVAPSFSKQEAMSEMLDSLESEVYPVKEDCS